MVTKEQALGDERYFHLGECKLHIGPRGGVKTDILSYRRNGQTKTYKKDPTAFKFPVKHGFYGPSSYITEKNAHMWHTEADCPVMKKLRETYEQAELKLKDKPFVAAEQQFSEGFVEVPQGWAFADTSTEEHDEEIPL